MRVNAIDNAGVGDLWRAYDADPRTDVRDRLIEAYQGYARILAARFYRQRVRDDVPFDEYLQLAQIGLIEAVDRFDPDRGILFETFAGKRIKGTIVDGISSMSEVQQQLAERRRRMQERTLSLAKNGAGRAEDGPDELFAQLADIAVGLAIGFAMESGDDGRADGPSYGDTTYSNVEMRQLRDLVLQAVRELPERVRFVITQHYLHQRPFAEVSDDLGITPGRVSQLHRDGIERLRSSLKRQARLDLQC